MQKNTQINDLISLGLTENEAKIYLATLSLGPSTILKISRTAEIKRTTAYSVVESLKQKGLMNIEIKGFKQLFVAENPESLKNILESKQTKLNQMLPDLTSLYNLKSEGGTIKYYEGLETIKTVYNGLIKDIKPHEDYMAISDMKQWHQLAPDFFQKFVEKRSKLNINIRLLLQDSKIARDNKKFEKNYNEKIKILPKDTNLITNCVIIPQRLVIQQLTPPIHTIVIENKSNIQMMQQVFNIIWNSIK